MKIKIFWCVFLCMMVLCCGIVLGSNSDKSGNDTQKNADAEPWFVTDIPKALNWVTDVNPENLCHGYFLEPTQISKVPSPPDVTHANTYITSKGPTHIESHGVSLIQDDVVVRQPGRILDADKAYIYRNKEGQLEWIQLLGHIDIKEHNHHVLATHAWISLKKNMSYANNVLYRVYSFFKNQNKYYNAWGRADTAKRKGNNWWAFNNATYSTCAPTSKVWTLHAKKLVLDTKDGVGKAYNAYLTVKGLPVMYSPYLWFPLDDRRRTGFLYPGFGYDDQQGYFFSIPWYWNMAPNYDLTITPRLMTERGILLQNEFRYLTRKSSGNIVFNINPHDSKFSDYRNTTLSKNYPSKYDAYVNALEKASNPRYLFRMKDHTRWTRRWKSNLDINYVSDNYYLQDYGDIASDENQLFNEFSMNYLGSDWKFIGLLQGYQTLHTFNGQSTDLNQDQYRRLPELDLSGGYPNVFLGTDFTLNAQAVNFAYSSDFSPERPIGQRIHFQPGLSKSINWSYGYIQPAASLDAVQYYSVKDFIAGETVSPSRMLPLFHVDSGLYFNRLLHWSNSHYLQTFEPRLFYLYVPYEDQTDLPNFDTYLLPFTYDQLFAENRFSGYDRFSNANQVSLSFTSRLLSAENASTKLSFNLGVLYYFTPLKVGLDSNDSSLTYSDNRWSPIVTQLAYYPFPHWSTKLNAAWNTQAKQLDNGGLALYYRPDGKHVFEAGYSYVYSDRQDIQGFSKSTNLLYLGMGWPINHRLSALTYFYYDFSKQISRNFILGVQYDACCWAIRVVGKRTYQGDELQTDGGYQRQFKTGVYIQILLKGFNVFGSRNIGAELMKHIPGYVDDF